MPETELLTPKEAANYRRCSIRKQDRERAEGRGPAYIRIDGRLFYRRSDLDRFIAAHIRSGEFRNEGAALRDALSRKESGDTPQEAGS